MNNIEKFVLGGVTLCIGSLLFIMNETEEVILTSNTAFDQDVAKVVIADVAEQVTEDVSTPQPLEVSVIAFEDESDMIVDEWDNKNMLAKNGDISFREAFANARTQLGPGQTFEWYGERYTTDYFYEIKTVVGEVVIVNNNEGNLELEQKESLADVEEIVTYRDNEEVKVSYEHLFPDAIAAAKKNGTYDDSKIMSND
ncbi:hypothetical protein OAS41_01260 [Candidatus Marinimicrobia bacterium]|nr:hypothetical protein [Candidatus Neomarinimicrobiota bacterium]MDC3287696.1 hypothetical protein [Candidatus Neomarinimicrobiota bacterium]